MQCPTCQADIDEDAEACFTCGMAVFALTQGQVLAGRYEIVRPLGRGGMGRVYEAFDRVMEEHVALKVLRTEFMRDREMSRRFVSEIKLARKIGHRNVCRIHEYGEDGNIRFIVMELLSGVTLKEYLHEEPLPPESAYDVSIQVARGLNAVHELGIVHRDVKTANVMIDEAGVAKLVDFGIAKEVSADLTDPSAAGMIMCTPEYMSPEQVHGGPGSFRSDIYALGCVVYELFTGHAPFRGATPVATFFMHLHDELPLEGEDAERIPPPLVPILKRALAKDPHQRYASIPEFADALGKAAAAGGFAAPHRGGLWLTARPPTAAERVDTATAVRPRRLWKWALAAAAIAVASALGVGYLAFFGPPPSALPAPVSMAPLAPSPDAEAQTVIPAGSAPPLSPSPSASATPSAPPPTPAATPSASPRSIATAPAAPPSPRAGAPPPATPAPRPSPVTGLLRLLVVPESQVSIDGTSLGAVSRRELPLGLGIHTVRVEHPDYQPLQRRVTIRAGDPENLVIDLAEKGIRRRP
jgi:serine/threonine protein kinase